MKPIEILAVEIYGFDAHLWAQQREGFIKGYNHLLFQLKELREGFPNDMEFGEKIVKEFELWNLKSNT